MKSLSNKNNTPGQPGKRIEIMKNYEVIYQTRETRQNMSMLTNGENINDIMKQMESVSDRRVVSSVKEIGDDYWLWADDDYCEFLEAEAMRSNMDVSP